MVVAAPARDPVPCLPPMLSKDLNFRCVRSGHRQLRHRPIGNDLPMAVFSSVRLGVSPEVNALATLFLAAVFLLVALAAWLMAKAERRR